MRPRPVPGVCTTTEVRVEICGVCGYQVSHELRSNECPDDGGPHHNVIVAVYERTDRFIRDEVVLK